MRYSDRDCWAALIRLASVLRKHGEDIGVALPAARRPSDWRAELAEFAEQVDVPIRRWSDDAGDCYGLEQRAGCYGGGVHPILYRSGSSGHSTPRWWTVSAGLGPGATNRETFCHIAAAAAGVLDMLRSEVTTF